MTSTSVALALALAFPAAQPEQATPDVNVCVQKGLKWLAGQQKEEGGWAGINRVPRTHFTAAAGLALLMEGSTPKEGAYAPHLRKAIEWMENNAQPSGQLGGRNGFDSNTMNDHALALLFLACAYDVDDDEERRARVGKLLEKAVDFACERQS